MMKYLGFFWGKNASNCRNEALIPVYSTHYYSHTSHKRREKHNWNKCKTFIHNKTLLGNAV